MNRPILLFGRTGQVGAALYARLAGRGDLVALDRTTVDLNEAASVRDAVHRHRPWLVLNAAAYTAVDAAERDEENAHRVNARAPGAMAAAASEIGAALIHFSTDYVFDGSKREPYLESDPTSPLSAYGRTKLAGERAIQASGVPYLIFRTSWVYAARGRNFLLAIVRRARDAGHVRVVNDQTGAPTSAAAIADAVVNIISGAPSADVMAQTAGIYHMTAAGSATWFDFAREILARTEIDADVQPISAQEFGAPAPRPRNSLLNNAKLRATFGVSLPDWRDQLADVLRDPEFDRG